MARPPCRAVGGEVVGLARAPDRAEDGRAASDESASRGDRARLVEDDRRIGIEVIPPREQRPRMVDGLAESGEPRWAEFRLIGQARRRPLRADPDARNDDREHHKDLAYQELGRSHAGLSPAWPTSVSAGWP